MPKQVPVRIVLDSSVLRQCPPGSIVAKRLQQLVEDTAVAVYIPWLVEDEVLTSIANDAAPLTKNQLRASKWFPSSNREAARVSLDAANKFLQDCERLVGTGIKELLDAMRAERLAPPPEAHKRVFSAYFAGSPPFSARKARNDIPDAFIFAAIEDAAKNFPNELHVVVEDKRLRKACSELHGVTVHAKIDTIFKLPALTPSLAMYAFVDFLRSAPTALKAKIEDELGDAIVYTEVVSPALPSDNEDATISGYGSLVDLHIDYDNVELLSERNALVPVECVFEDCLVTLYVAKSVFYAGDHHDRFSVNDGDWNDYYLEAEGHLNVRVAATLAMEFDSNEGYAVRAVEVVHAEEISVVL